MNNNLKFMAVSYVKNFKIILGRWLFEALKVNELGNFVPLGILKNTLKQFFIPIFIGLIILGLAVLIVDITIFFLTEKSHITTINDVINHMPLSFLLFMSVFLLIFLRGLGFFSHILNLFKNSKNLQRARKNLNHVGFSAYHQVMYSRPPMTMRILGYTLLMIPVVIILWSIFAKVEVNISATGSLVPQGRTKVVQSSESGVVKAIHVKNGDRVKAGDLLVELDQNLVDVELASLVYDAYTTRVQLSILKALLEDKQNPVAHWIYPKDLKKEDLEFYKNAMLIRSGNHRKKINFLEQEAKTIRAEKNTILATIRKIENILPLLEEQLITKRILVSKNLHSKNELTSLEQEFIEQKGEISIQQHRLHELNRKYETKQAMIQQTDSDFDMAILSEIVEMKKSLKVAEMSIPSSEYKKQQTYITAAVEGVIEQSILRAPGQVVKEADQIMTIVPETEILESEIKILNKDIGFLNIGQIVDIRIDTFQFTKYGSIKGKIIEISTDAIDDPELGFIYTARVEMERDYMNVKGKKIPLSVGMTTSVAIKTGERRIIEFVLSPLLRYKENAFRER